MKKWKKSLLFLGVLVFVISALCSDIFYPEQSTRDHVNQDISTEILMEVTVDRDSVCMIYRAYDHISTEDSVIKYVFKAEGSEIVYKYAVSGEYIPEHMVKESYKFSNK